jgi:FkbM family methyltransferase
VPPGGLVFDVGAHVGDRTASFRRLGARVVALEPQPGAARALRLIHGRDPGVTLVEAAVADAEGVTRLHLNLANPTVSTTEVDFIAAASGAPGWQGQVWGGEVAAPTVTLDALVAHHGRPDFVKIDVEGAEDRVLAGLSRPVPSLSFEATTIRRDVALRCLDRLAALGAWSFNASRGETLRLEFDTWLDAPGMRAWLAALPAAANAVDVVARCIPDRPGPLPA